VDAARRTVLAGALASALALGGPAVLGADDKATPPPPAAKPQTQSALAKEKAAVAAFLKQKAEEPGAEELPSGLIYKLLKPGSGPSPGPASTVKVHYDGRLVDGTLFDSSRKRGEPSVFPLGRVIKCWTEGLAKMKVGEQAQLVCPAHIAYGERGQPGLIPGGATLVFEVELISIESKDGRPDPVVAAAQQKEAARAVLAAEAAEPGAQVSKSGVIYRPIKPGVGARPSESGAVTVHYTGLLVDGTVFDSSHKSDAPVSFPLSAVIPCWREGMQKMQVGETARLTCPSQTAYGDAGQPPVVPPGATLRFDVELLAVAAE
jgi:FKBP-type peptidyl-prolyl cis-trans isomerase